MEKGVEKTKPELVLNIKAISEKNRLANDKPLYYSDLAKRYGFSEQTVFLWQKKMPRVVSFIKQIMDDYEMTFEEVIKYFEPKEKRQMKKRTRKSKSNE